MHKIYFAFLAVSFFASCSNQNEQAASNSTTAAAKPDTGDKIIQITKVDDVDTAKKSIKALATKNINGKHVSVYYHSPAVRGREIWGGLVPFDTPWVTGAHMATTLETDAPLQLDAASLPAGKYGLFTIPSEGEWTFIVNKNWQQHLTDEYDPKDDLIRIKIRPDTLDYTQQRLMWSIDQTGENRGELEFRWERLRLRLPIQIVN